MMAANTANNGKWSKFVWCGLPIVAAVVVYKYVAKRKTIKRSAEDGKCRFFRHFKHDANNEEVPNNYMYEVVGIGTHSESKEKLVTYRPLYANPHMDGLDFIHRPYDMFFDSVQRSTYVGRRFTEITDKETIQKLIIVSKEMYPRIQYS
mmetsp:Transcript_32275/g.51754  ORF Transcript_32275/g.51754 Transcript_32275/m.51754 type:complete len:149 (-) Transcript_32275:72-518(-)